MVNLPKYWRDMFAPGDKAPNGATQQLDALNARRGCASRLGWTDVKVAHLTPKELTACGLVSADFFRNRSVICTVRRCARRARSARGGRRAAGERRLAPPGCLHLVLRMRLHLCCAAHRPAHMPALAAI